MGGHDHAHQRAHAGSRPFLRGRLEQALDGYMREPIVDPTRAKKVFVRSKGDPKQLTSLQSTRC
jgi:hypothetical protein